MHFLSKSGLLIQLEWISSCGMTSIFLLSVFFFLYIRPCHVEVVGDVTVVFEFFFNPLTMFLSFTAVAFPSTGVNQWFLSYAGLFELLSWLRSDKSLLFS